MHNGTKIAKDEVANASSTYVYLIQEMYTSIKYRFQNLFSGDIILPLSSLEKLN